MAPFPIQDENKSKPSSECISYPGFIKSRQTVKSGHSTLASLHHRLLTIVTARVRDKATNRSVSPSLQSALVQSADFKTRYLFDPWLYFQYALYVENPFQWAYNQSMIGLLSLQLKHWLWRGHRIWNIFSESAPKLNFGTFEESLSYHIKLFMLYRWIRKRRLCNFVYFCLHSQHVISCSHPAGPPIIHRQSCLKDREWLKWWLIIHDIIKPHLGSPGIDTFR